MKYQSPGFQVLYSTDIQPYRQLSVALLSVHTLHVMLPFNRFNSYLIVHLTIDYWQFTIDH